VFAGPMPETGTEAVSGCNAITHTYRSQLSRDGGGQITAVSIRSLALTLPVRRQ
jgi:hypothetical protein